MKVLFVFYVPSGGVETLDRQRRAALELAGISSHFLYYGKRRDLVNDHGAPLYITNEDSELKQIFDTNEFDAAIVTSDFLSFPRFRRLGFKGKLHFGSARVWTEGVSIFPIENGCTDCK